MDFGKSDVQTMLLDSAERLLAETSGVECWREQRHNPAGFDEARWAQFAELGWLALPAPEAFGGLDGTVEDVALLNIALGKALATEPYVSTVVAAMHLLAGAASAAVTEALISQIVVGEARIAVAQAEPGADPLRIVPAATTAKRSGEGFVLTGRKFMVHDAASATALIVSAKLDGEEGTALLLVDPAAAGVSIDGYPLIDGTRAADIGFADVALTADALLASGAAGTALLAEANARASVANMAQAVGAMEACLKLCGDYVKERKQFGQAISSFQAIQHILSDMFVAAYQARSMLYQAIAGSREPAAKRDAAISAARIVIGEAGQLVSRSGIQVHGGYGVTDEYAVSHYFRRLMSLEKQYGDLHTHTAQLGTSIVARMPARAGGQS